MSSIYEVYDDEGTVSFLCTGDIVDDAIAQVVGQSETRKRSRNTGAARVSGAQPDYDLWT